MTDLLRLMSDLDNGANLFGPLAPDIRARLFAVVDNPSQATWADAHGIILTNMTTLWQALLRFTDYDVRVGPTYVPGESPHWPTLPTREQLVAAITTALNRNR